MADVLDTPSAGPLAVRGAALRVGGYVAGVVLTTVSAALLFRHLGVDDTGRYVTVLALLAIVSGITDIGLSNIGMRELAVRDAAAGRRLLEDLLGIRLVLAVLGVVAVTVFALAAGYGSAMLWGTVIAGLAVIATAAQSTLGVALMVQLRFGWLTGIDLVRQAVLVAGIVIGVIAGAGLFPFLVLQVPAALVALALTAWLVRGGASLRPAFRGAEWRPLLREVLPFAAAAIMAAVYFRASLIVLGLVSSSAETGYFGAAFRVTDVLLLIPSLMVGAAFPIFARAARDDHARLAYGVDRVFQVALLAGSGLMTVIVLGAPFAIDVVAGADFAPSVPVLRIQSVALVGSFVATALFYALLSLHLHRGIMITAGVALAANIALSLVLGSSHGAQGAAVATLVAEAAGILVAAVTLARAHPDVLPGLRCVPRIAVAAGLPLALLLVPGLPSVVAALLGAALFAGLALLLRVVPDELRDALPFRRSAAA